MKTKNIPINPKKIPYYLALILLTAGASLILGFLSFGGMYALLPFLSLAVGAFGLSVAYEGEIYLQNIKGALGKLFKQDYLKNRIAREYLLEHFPDTHAEQCPQFFKDYERQLQLLALFDHKKLTKDSKKQKKKIEKTLKEMEKWFASQLLGAHQNDEAESQTAYAQELQNWLAQEEQNQAQWQARLNKRRTTFYFVGAFSVLSAAFMGLGSTYLIMEAFSVIPFMATIPFALWPFIIVPMALIAGAAYGLLTYNTVTDLINNNTLVKWYKKFRTDLSGGLSVRNVFMVTMAVVLVALAVALTICTAGTWWTVATSARPLFDWMRKMPSLIMGVINPIITGFSAVFFNIQNTAESLEMLDAATRSKTNFFKQIFNSIKEGFTRLKNTENWLQILNPFRLLLKLTITPLRIVLFLGHLLSIALTADRMPGIPQIVSALIAIISEGFEDAHYFVGHSHGHAHEHHHEPHEHGEEHGHKHHKHDKAAYLKELREERLGAGAGHSHDADIPTKILKFIALPLYALATVWDYLSSKLNSGYKAPLTLAQAWNKQLGIQTEANIRIPEKAKQPSNAWKVEHTLALINKYEQKHLAKVVIGKEIAEEKRTALHDLSQRIKKANPDELPQILAAEKGNSTYNPHRLFAQQDKSTASQDFISELPIKVNAL